MSLHDYSHGPYDDSYEPNWRLYFSDSDDENEINYDNPTNWDLKKVCDNYMEVYDEILGTYKASEKIYKAINILEETLNIPKDESSYPKLDSTKFNTKYFPIIAENIIKEFNTIKDAVDYVHPLYIKLNKLADKLFRKKLQFCQYLHELADKGNIELSNWKQINEFLGEF